MRARALAIIGLSGMLAVLESGCGSVASAPPPLSVSTASLPDGFVAFPYSQAIQAAGEVPPYKWTVASGNLPDGLALGNDSSGVAKIAGTPDTAETAVAFSVQVVDAKNQMATHSYTVNVDSTEIAQLQQVQGSVPAGTVEIQGLSAGSFNPAYWQRNTLNWVPDVRLPMLAPQTTSPYQNIYAPWALEIPAGWRMFYGGWDGSDTQNDRVYSVTTSDFLTFDNRALVIDHGAFIHVNNVNVQRVGDGSLHMICTAYPDQNNLDKPAYFSSPDGITWNGSPQPYQAQLSDIASIEGYSNFQTGEFNGANVLLWDGSTWTLYFSNWNDQGPNGAMYRAMTDSPPSFVLQGLAMNTTYGIQDVSIFQGGGQSWYVAGFSDNASSLWYSLSHDGIHFGATETLFSSLSTSQDRYIVSLGFVTSGNQLLGIVYGAGSDPALDENRIFGRWLQNKLVITDSAGTEHAVQGAFGPDRQWLQISGGTLQGTISVYSGDGLTPLAAGPVSLGAGTAYQLVLSSKEAARKK
jgi:hypothetical protein